MSSKTKVAKDIHDCDECPLYQNDCIGGWTSNGSGTPIEPPCTSWNDNDEIYEGMYDCEVEYSAETLEWIICDKQSEKKKNMKGENNKKKKDCKN